MSARDSPRPRSCSGASRPGDRIALDQVFVEIETAKSLVELPSAFEGVVSELLVDEGKTVDVGTPILVIQTDAARRGCRDAGSLGRAPRAPAAAAPAVGAAPSRRTPPPPSEGGGAVLVGHGSSGPAATRRKRHPSPGGAHESLATVPAPAAARARRHRRRAPSAGRSATPRPRLPPRRAEPRPDSGVPVIAKPPIRKLAKDLGVDLSRVTPTGPIGDITRDDVIRDGEPGERLPQHPDARVADRSRGPHPREGRAQGHRERDGAECILRAACERLRRRRRHAHDGVRQAAQGLARLRGRAGSLRCSSWRRP